MPTSSRRGLLLTLVLASLMAGSLPAQDDPVIARMRKDITFLASDECEGRGVGTVGLDKAADYIAARFAEAGLKPGGGNGWFQHFPFATNATLDGASSLVLQGPQGQKIKLVQGTDFQVLGSSPSTALNAPLVFVGYGATINDIGYDDYADIDVQGKIVVMLRRLPRWNAKEWPFPATNKNELAELKNEAGSLDTKQTRAMLRKAAAVILVNDATELPGDNLIPFAQLAKAISTLSMPFVQLKRSVLDDVMRSSLGQSLNDIEKAIDGDLKPRSLPLKDWRLAMDVKVKRTEVPVKNVVGILEGKGPLANETVVIGAHYDHLGYGGGGSRAKDPAKKDIHHGADDNASGSTAVIELARRFAAMKNREGRRLVFMTFTAEERGLIGSRHYTRIEPLFPLKNTTAMFNLDMVGRLKDDVENGKKPKLLVEGADTGKEFDSLLIKLNPGFDVVKEKSVFGASDHYSFYLQKIPVLFFWTGTHSDYHRPTDTSDKINVAGMKRITDYAEKVIDHLRTDPKRPQYVYVPTTFKMGSIPKLGISPDYTFGGKGLLLEGVAKDGPADKAGLKKGDVIIEIAGKAVPNINAYMAVLQTQKSGTTLSIKILRDSKELQLKVTPK